MTNHEFLQIMDVYKETGQKLSVSDEAVIRIKQIALVKRRTSVGRKIACFNMVLVLAILCMIPLTAYAGSRVYQILSDKVEDADMTPDEIENLGNQLEEQGFTEDNISKLDELKTNENGLTYGPDALGADLIAVFSDDGKLGYVYRKDLESGEATSVEEALQQGGEVKLNVYASDGETVIGTFTLTDGKEK